MKVLSSELNCTRVSFSSSSIRNPATVEPVLQLSVPVVIHDAVGHVAFLGSRSVEFMPGFVRVTGPSELAFPDYDGNGMFKSLGNIPVNPSVSILFIAMHGKPQRLRVNGEATVSDRDPLLAQTVGAQLIVRVAARAIFPNCPRYIPTLQLIEPSKYAPQPRCETPEPAWKDFADFKNYVHPRQSTFKG